MAGQLSSPTTKGDTTVSITQTSMPADFTPPVRPSRKPRIRFPSFRRLSSRMAVSEFHFRGSGNVMQPNHITRYIYPSLIYPKEFLILQAPQNSAQRPRPQGEHAYDTTFATITPAPKRSPTRDEFQAWLIDESSKDHTSKNPCGRAMRRVTGFPGNTTLECGKFRLRGPRVVFVIVRTTVLRLGGKDRGKARTDQDVYEMPAEKWRDIMPETVEPDAHDCWWVRLHDLITQGNDRAYWNVQKRLDELGISEPIRQWFPRKDIAKQNIEIYYDPAKAKLPEDEKNCWICMEEYFVKADFPAKLPCGHFLCLTDMTNMHDNADGVLTPGESDPGFPFWRCPVCRLKMPIEYDRLGALHPAELPYLRWKTMHNFMQQKMTGRDFNTYLALSVQLRYIDQFSEAENNGAEIAKTLIRYADATSWIDNFVLPTAALLPWGYSVDNPVTFAESQTLVREVKLGLRELEALRKKWTLKALIQQLEKMGQRAIKPVVVDKEWRLGNPVLPPGYDRFRAYLCEWAARGCFLAPGLVQEHKEFVRRMQMDTGVWWKGHRFLKG